MIFRGNVCAINIGDVPGAKVIDRAVIGKVPAFPAAALIAIATIAKAIVYAAIISNLRAPVTAVKQIAAATPAPKRRSPQHTD